MYSAYRLLPANTLQTSTLHTGFLHTVFWQPVYCILYIDNQCIADCILPISVLHKVHCIPVHCTPGLCTPGLCTPVYCIPVHCQQVQWTAVLCTPFFAYCILTTSILHTSFPEYSAPLFFGSHVQKFNFKENSKFLIWISKSWFLRILKGKNFDQK